MKETYLPKGGGKPGGFKPGGFKPGGFKPGGFKPGGFKPGGFKPGGFKPGGFKPGGFKPGGFKPGGPNNPAGPGGSSKGGRGILEGIETLGRSCCGSCSSLFSISAEFGSGALSSGGSDSSNISSSGCV